MKNSGGVQVMELATKKEEEPPHKGCWGKPTPCLNIRSGVRAHLQAVLEKLLWSKEYDTLNLEATTPPSSTSSPPNPRHGRKPPAYGVIGNPLRFIGGGGFPLSLPLRVLGCPSGAPAASVGRAGL